MCLRVCVSVFVSVFADKDFFKQQEGKEQNASAWRTSHQDWQAARPRGGVGLGVGARGGGCDGVNVTCKIFFGIVLSFGRRRSSSEPRRVSMAVRDWT